MDPVVELARATRELRRLVVLSSSGEGEGVDKLEEEFRKVKLRVEMLRVLIAAEEDEEGRVVRFRPTEHVPRADRDEAAAPSSGSGHRVPTALDKFDSDATDQPHPDAFLRRFSARLTVEGVPCERWAAILAVHVVGSAEGWAQRELLGASSWAEAREVFSARFKLPQDELRRRAELYSIQQQGSETVLQYAARLEDALVAVDKSADGRDAMALFQKGLASPLHTAYVTAVSTRPPFNMSEAVSIARGLEAAIPAAPQRGGGQGDGGRAAKTPVVCFTCQGRGHYARECPKTASSASAVTLVRAATSSRRCYVCGDPSHMARECPKKAQPEDVKPAVQAVVAPESWSPSEVTFTAEQKPPSRIRAQLPGAGKLAPLEVEAALLLLSAATVQGLRVMMVIDSAAQVSCVDRRWLAQHGIPYRSHRSQLKVAGEGNAMEVHGEARLEVRHGTSVAELQFIVVDLEGANPVLLGAPHFADIGVSVGGLQAVFPEVGREANQISAATEWGPGSTPEEYVAAADLARIEGEIAPALEANQAVPLSRLCSFPGCEVRLETTKAVPYIRQYDIAEKFRPRVDAQVVAWAESGVIEPGSPDAQCNLSLTTAEKKDLNGEKTGVRVCLDARPLNSDLPDDRVPIPLVRDVFERVRGFTVCSRLDLAQGYHQIPVREEDRHKLTFSWGRKRWQFRGAPFGVKHLSTHFQRVMSAVLEGTEDFVVIFIDDIFVFSSTVSEHIQHVRTVVERLTAYNLTLRRAKCAFGLRRAELLGHVVEGDKLRPMPQKLSSALRLKRPETVKQVQVALGLINYLRAFIPRASAICAPLSRLAAAKEFVWDENCEEAWNAVRAVLSSPPVLHAPVRGVPYMIGTDASQAGVGASLFQEVEGRRQYIAFASRALTDGQRNYPATKRELLAVVFALDRFRRWVLGTHFTVVTDHRALTYLMSQRGTKSYVLQNWFEQLMEYDFDVVHAPGAAMVLEDAFSRLDLTVCNVIVDEPAISDAPSTGAAEREGERLAVVQRCHALAHAGAAGMVRMLRDEGHDWRGMHVMCAHVARLCSRCRAVNPARPAVHQLTSILSTVPFDHVSVDLCGPLPVSNEGYLYVLVVVDVATRYVVLRPLRSKTALEAAETLATVITEYGAPRIIQSDNGREFRNQVVRALAVVCGMDHRFVQPYHPRANGLSEAAVKVVKALLFKLLQDDFERWHSRLHAVQYALNNRVMLRTGMKPFTLFFGREPNSFADYAEAEVTEVDLPGLLERVRVLYEEVWPAAREYAEGRAASERQEHDARATLVQFHPGDIVMRVFNSRNKHQKRYKGPYRVARRTQGGAYVLIEEDGEDVCKAPPVQLKLVSAASAIDDEEEELSGQMVLGHRRVHGVMEYLVESDGRERPRWLSGDAVGEEALQQYFQHVEDGE